MREDAEGIRMLRLVRSASFPITGSKTHARQPASQQCKTNTAITELVGLREIQSKPGKMPEWNIPFRKM